MELIALPSPPITVVEIPVAAVATINLPVVAVSVLPVGFIPVVPEHTTFTASGSGAATVAAKPTTRAAATGVGAVQVLTRAVIAAAASGSGKLIAPAYVVGQAFPTSIEATGSGSTTAVSSAGTAIAAAGSGALTASPGTTITATGQSATLTTFAATVRAAATGTGSGTAAPASRSTATATGTGTATVSASTYLPQKMVKSGAYTLPGNLNYWDVLGWVADGGYPGTVVTNDGLAVKGGRPITVSATVLRGGTNAGNRARIVDTAGTEIAAVTGASPITVGPITYTPSVDTVLRIQAYANSGLGGNPTIPDNPASQLTVTPI